MNDTTERVDKVLAEINELTSLEDIANLLDYCAKISHCNLIHWLFALKLMKSIAAKELAGDGFPQTQAYQHRLKTVFKIFNAVEIWTMVGKAEPLTVNFNDQNENIEEYWENLKNEIITSQYALEICYDEISRKENEANV